MNKSKINHVIEYFSSTLVLSYFFIHNIFLVQIGIIISLYLINNDFINRILISIYKNFIYKNLDIEIDVCNKEIKTNPIQIKSTKEVQKLTLVETIEELGFIPSIEKNDESSVA